MKNKLRKFLRLTVFQNTEDMLYKTTMFNSDLVKRLSNIPKKLKLTHYTLRRHCGEKTYSSYSFLTSALDSGEWSTSHPGRALAPGKGSPVPTVQEAGWAPEPVWTQRLKKKSFCLCWGLNLDRPVVQPVAKHYTDWAAPAHPIHSFHGSQKLALALQNNNLQEQTN
jgi:hypothetical protein